MDEEMAASAAASSRAHPSRPGSEKKRAIVLHTFVVIHEHSFGFGLFRSFTKIFRSASATSHGRRPVQKSGSLAGSVALARGVS